MFSLTFDYWSSIATKSFLTLTIHFIDQDFKLKDYVLKTIEVRDSHTGENTAKIINTVLEEFNIKFKAGLGTFAVSDAARNMKKTAIELSLPHLCCFAHILHNTLIKSFEEIEISTLISKAHKLAIYFRSSPKKTNVLIDMQNKLKLKNIKLKLDVETRWNSTYDMIERLLGNKIPIINLALEDKNIENLNLTGSEWEDALAVKELLGPFKIISDLLCSSGNPSISLLQPLIFNIGNNLLKEVPYDNPLIKLLKKAMNKNFCAEFLSMMMYQSY